MSDSEEEVTQREDPMPENKIIFTDFSEALVEKCIRQVAKTYAGHKMDKDAASAIQKMISKDPDFIDEQSGWHVIVGKSFASAITYQTKNVLFFNLLGDVHKSFLIFKTSEHPIPQKK